MTVAAAVAADYQWRDDIQTVTFTNSSTSVATVKASRGAVQQPEGGAGPEFGAEPKETIWVLWADTLSDEVPVAGNTVTDAASDVWLVVSVEINQHGATVLWYACRCRKQVS